MKLVIISTKWKQGGLFYRPCYFMQLEKSKLFYQGVTFLFHFNFFKNNSALTLIYQGCFFLLTT